jgi:hypothetical protein
MLCSNPSPSATKKSLSLDDHLIVEAFSIWGKTFLKVGQEIDEFPKKFSVHSLC